MTDVRGANPQTGKTKEQLAKDAIVEAEQKAWQQWYYNELLIRNGAYKPTISKDMWEETIAPLKTDLSDEAGQLEANGTPRSLKADTYYRLSSDYDIEMFVSMEKDQFGKSTNNMLLRATSNLSGSMPGTIARREEFYRKGYMQLALQGNTRVVINFPKEAKAEFIKIDEIHRMMRIAKECKLEIDFGDKIQEFIQRDVHARSALDKDRLAQNQVVASDREHTLESSNYYQHRRHQELKTKVKTELGGIQQTYQDNKTSIATALNAAEPDTESLKKASDKLDTLEKRMTTVLGEAQTLLDSTKTEARVDEFKEMSDADFGKIKTDYDALINSLTDKQAELITKKSAVEQKIRELGDPAPADTNEKKEQRKQHKEELTKIENTKNSTDALLGKAKTTFESMENTKAIFDAAITEKKKAFHPDPNPAPVAGH